MQTAFFDKYLANALRYDAYIDAWKMLTEAPLTGLDKLARRYRYYAKYNWERAERMEQAYEMSERLHAAVALVQAPQHWVVITEDWCVDSAFSLPIMHRAAALNPHITLHVLRREANLELMDRHLTNGARSIPKLLAFDDEGTLLFEWGPRPAEIQQQREAMKAAGAPGAELSKRVLEWYEAGGWKQTDTELAEALEMAAAQHLGREASAKNYRH